MKAVAWERETVRHGAIQGSKAVVWERETEWLGTIQGFQSWSAKLHGMERSRGSKAVVWEREIEGNNPGATRLSCGSAELHGTHRSDNFGEKGPPLHQAARCRPGWEGDGGAKALIPCLVTPQGGRRI